MKLLSTPLEMRAIKTICSSKSKIAGLALSRLDESHFHYGPTKEAFIRIHSIVRASGKIPNYQEICSDPALEEDSRKSLRANEQHKIKYDKDLSSLFRGLDKYRKLRGLYFTSEQILKALKSSKIEVEDVLDTTSHNISNIRSKIELQKDIFHLGRNNNTVPLIKKMLDGSPPEIVPTGFEAFDRKNGGFFPGSLVVIASTSGGGKSALGNQMLINMSLLGYDTVIVPLEMTEEETVARIAAERSGIDITKILRKQLTYNEKRIVKKQMKKFIMKLKKEDSRYSIFAPEEDMNGEDILMMLEPYGYHVEIIDYINLLKDVNGEESWKQLSNVARFCKTHARITKKVVILIAQLNDEGRVKYSRGVTEHANNCWVWSYTDENRESGIIDIRQPKARNQVPFNFQLHHDFSKMQIRDLHPGEEDKLRSKQGDKRRVELDDLVQEIETEASDIE